MHDECSGRPSIITDDLIELVRERFMQNRRFAITELSSHFPQISCSMLHKIVTEQLLFRKLCASWVTDQLTPEHKAMRMESALTFCSGTMITATSEFLDRLITGDETWVAHITPETKQQSMHWRTVDLPARRNSSRLCQR